MNSAAPRPMTSALGFKVLTDVMFAGSVTQVRADGDCVREQGDATPRRMRCDVYLATLTNRAARARCSALPNKP